MIKPNHLKLSSITPFFLYFILLCIFSLGNSLSAQTNPYIDSLIKIKDATKDECEKASKYIEISRFVFGSDMQASLDYVNEGIQLAEKNICYENLASLYITKSIILGNMGENDASIKVIDKSILIYQFKVKNPLNLGKAFHTKGNAYLSKNLLPETLDNYLKALSSIENIDSDKEVNQFKAIILEGIGGIYAKLRQYDLALNYIHQSVELFPIVNDSERFITHHINLSTIYKVQNLFDLALENVNIADSANHTLKNPVHQIDINLNKAYIYSYMDKHNEAIELIKSTQLILNSLPHYSYSNERFVITSSKVFYKAKRYKESIAITLEYLNKIENENYNSGNKVNLIHTIYLSYKSLGDYQNALKYLEEYKMLTDNVSGEEIQNEMNRLKEEYESEKKMKEISILREKNNVSQLEIKLKNDQLKFRTYFILFLTILFILIIVSVFFIYRQARLKQQKKADQLEHKALRAQMNPHFIFNALNSIQRIYVEGEIDKANDYMADFAQLMRKILENSSLSKITLDEEIETLRLYMDLERLRCKNSFKYNILIDENLSTVLKIAPLILQPFVENSIRHGILPLNNTKGEIEIQIIDFDKDYIQITIKDNGVGFDSNNLTKNKNSKGISITSQRIDGKITIESSPSKGTIVTFKLKKQYD